MRDPAGRLEAFLEAEKTALLTGDLQSLADLLEEKEALIKAALENAEGAPLALTAIQRKLRVNQPLFDAALEGMRAAAKRLAQIKAVDGTFEIYSADGQRRDIRAAGQASVERRA